MRKGVDYSTRPADWRTFAKTLRAAGYDAVGRYLWEGSGEKGLTLAEAKIMSEEGIDIFCYYESTTTRALGGYQAGYDDAVKARKLANNVQMPEEAPIYFTVDFDATDEQLINHVHAYFEGVRSTQLKSQIGAYGGIRTIKYLFDNGLINYACQTEAWSYPGYNTKKPVMWEPRAQIRQWTVHGPGTIGGVQCDGLDIVSSSFGQWRIGVAMADTVEREIKALRLSMIARQLENEAIAMATIIGDKAEARKLWDAIPEKVAAKRKEYGL